MESYKPPFADVSVSSDPPVLTGASQSLNPKTQSLVRIKHRCLWKLKKTDAIYYQNRRMLVLTAVCVLCRGQISRDYEQEFPSVEVGPQLVWRGGEEGTTTGRRQVGIGRVGVFCRLS